MSGLISAIIATGAGFAARLRMFRKDRPPHLVHAEQQFRFRTEMLAIAARRGLKIAAAISHCLR
jgi:hypothetical protein